MATADRPNIPIGDASQHYVDRRSKELLKRYRGTRERRQKKAEQLAEASQYQLMLAQFKKHRVAWVCLYLLVLLYVIAIFAPFVAPYDKLQRFEDAIRRCPEVLECYLMTGPRDYLLRVVARDLADYERFVKDTLTRIDGIANIESSFALGQVKHASALPLDGR